MKRPSSSSTRLCSTGRCVELCRSSQEEEPASDPRRWGYANLAGAATGSEVAARLSSSIADYEYPLPYHASQAGTGGPATGAGSYAHNTYHGQVRHQRAPLIMDNPKPLRFTDSLSGQLYSPSGYRQRRRSSNASNDSDVIALPIVFFVLQFLGFVRFFIIVVPLQNFGTGAFDYNLGLYDQYGGYNYHANDHGRPPPHPASSQSYYGAVSNDWTAYRGYGADQVPGVTVS